MPETPTVDETRRLALEQARAILDRCGVPIRPDLWAALEKRQRSWGPEGSVSSTAAACIQSYLLAYHLWALGCCAGCGGTDDA